MRFLITMNMPSAKGYAVHQVTVEHSADSVQAFHRELQENDFILCNLMYKFKLDDFNDDWEDRGKIILNTAHIGKAQEFVDYNGRDT